MENQEDGKSSVNVVKNKKYYFKKYGMPIVFFAITLLIVVGIGMLLGKK